MRSIVLYITIMMIIINHAVGVVTISNSYYSADITVRDNVYLENCNYDNRVDLYPSDIVAIGEANSSEDGLVYAHVEVPGNSIGASLEVQSDDMKASKSFGAGSTDSWIGLSYNHLGGYSEADAYNSYTSVQHILDMSGCDYSGSIKAKPDSILLEGIGSRSLVDFDIGKLRQDLILRHAGKTAETELSVIESSDLGNPLNFEWKTYMESYNKNQIHSAVDFSVYHGQRTASLEMDGKSDVDIHLSGSIEPEVNDFISKESWWIYYTID